MEEQETSEVQANRASSSCPSSSSSSSMLKEAPGSSVSNGKKRKREWSEEERAQLIRCGCAFIKQLSDSLKLQLLSQCTALVFFHRFFQRQQLQEHDRFVVGTASVFLAAKVEEDLKKLVEVVRHAQRLHDFSRNGCLEMLEKKSTVEMGLSAEEAQPLEEARSTKSVLPIVQEKVLLCERVLLHTMAFDVSVVHPHVSANNFIRNIRRSEGPMHEFRLASWTFLNDSLFTDTCIKFKPDAIAAASVLLAYYHLREKKNLALQTVKALDQLKRDQLNSKSDLFLGFKRELIHEIVHRMLDIYESPQPFKRHEI